MKNNKLFFIPILFILFLTGCTHPREKCMDQPIPGECLKEHALEIQIYEIFNFIFALFGF